MQKDTLIYYTTCSLLVFSSKPVEYKCCIVYLGRIDRREQSDITYQRLLLSAQRIVERPGVKIYFFFLFSMRCLPHIDDECSSPASPLVLCTVVCHLKMGSQNIHIFLFPIFWTILRPVRSYFKICYLYFSAIHKHLTDHRYDSPPCTGLLLLSFKKIINTLMLSTNCLAGKLGFVHL